MSYLRALMVGEGEMSERALALTGDIIAMNPAHYTIWYPYKGMLTQGISCKDSICARLDFEEFGG
jgi:hypothetical protein